MNNWRLHSSDSDDTDNWKYSSDGRYRWDERYNRLLMDETDKWTDYFLHLVDNIDKITDNFLLLMDETDKLTKNLMFLYFQKRLLTCSLSQV